jgi:hypothetical protein
MLNMIPIEILNKNENFRNKFLYSNVFNEVIIFIIKNL